MKKEFRRKLTVDEEYVVYSDFYARSDIQVTNGVVSLTLERDVYIKMNGDEARLAALALIRAADLSEEMDW